MQNLCFCVSPKYINNTLTTQKLSHEFKPNKKFEKSNSKLAETSQADSLSVIFGQYNRLTIEKMLNDIESGMDLTVAWQLNFDYADALKIYQNALKLIKNKDGSHNHKFINKNRKLKSEHPLIAPTPLHYHQEIALANLCFANTEDLCQSIAGRRELAEFIKTFYDKLIPSKPEIRFTYKQTKEFYAYVQTALKLLPSEYWRINICKYTPTTVVDKKTGEEKFTMPVDRKVTGQAMAQFDKKFADFRGDMTQKTIYSGFSISMIRPNDKGKPTKKQPNSVLIKYVVHWLLIMGNFGDFK